MKKILLRIMEVTSLIKKYSYIPFSIFIVLASALVQICTFGKVKAVDKAIQWLVKKGY